MASFSNDRLFRVLFVCPKIVKYKKNKQNISFLRNRIRLRVKILFAAKFSEVCFLQKKNGTKLENLCIKLRAQFSISFAFNFNHL